MISIKKVPTYLIPKVNSGFASDAIETLDHALLNERFDPTIHPSIPLLNVGHQLDASGLRELSSLPSFVESWAVPRRPQIVSFEEVSNLPRIFRRENPLTRIPFLLA